MTIKICHLTNVHSFNDIRIFQKECKTLYKAGFDVTLVAQHEHDEVVEGVKILAVSTPLNRKQRMTSTVRQIYQQATKVNADIYHFHDPELITVGLCLKKKGKIVIYDAHEDLPRQIMTKDWIPRSARVIISRIAEIIEDFAARKFDAIICATPFITARFMKLNKRVININNYPILQELFIPQSESFLKETAVCYVGGIHKLRGIYEMIDAIDKTDAELLLAGTFDSMLERQQAVKKSGWYKIVELGHINREQVRDVLGHSRAGLVLFHPAPNHINAQPNKMFEYMSSEIPVIASNFPLWKEIIESNKCGICVNPLDPQDIAKAITWIIDHPSESEQMGKNARIAVEQSYNWENEAIKLIQLYNSLENQCFLS